MTVAVLTMVSAVYVDLPSGAIVCSVYGHRSKVHCGFSIYGMGEGCLL